MMWQEIGGGSSEGTAFNTSKLDNMKGSEIVVDILQPDTTIGQMFFTKRKSVNMSTIVVHTVGNYIHTNVMIGGKYFPIEMRLIQGTSPIVLGRDFFTRFRWNNPTNNMIDMPSGVVCLKRREISYSSTQKEQWKACSARRSSWQNPPRQHRSRS